MPHIHTEPGQIDHTATAYIMLVRPGEAPRALVHVHRKLGMLLPPGGHVELHESPWQAIAHEIAEESGYTLEELSVLQPRERVKELAGVMLHPQPLFMNTHLFASGIDHYHSDVAYALVASDMPNGAPAEGESQAVSWLTRAEVAAQDETTMFDNTRIALLAIFDTFLDVWELVPATDYELTLPQ